MQPLENNIENWASQPAPAPDDRAILPAPPLLPRYAPIRRKCRNEGRYGRRLPPDAPDVPKALTDARDLDWDGSLLPGCGCSGDSGKGCKAPLVTFADKTGRTGRITRRGFEFATPRRIAKWLWRFRYCEVWLLRTGRIRIAGRRRRIIVIDADNPAAVGLAMHHLPYTPWRVKTPRGMHFYYLLGDGFDRPAYRIKQIDGIDEKTGKNQYVIAPGSRRAAGEYVAQPGFGVGIPPTLDAAPLLALAQIAPRRKPGDDAAADTPAPAPDDAPETRAERRRADADAPAPIDAPAPPDPGGKCRYQDACLGSRNSRMFRIIGRRLVKNWREGDPRVTVAGMQNWVETCNENNWGHPVPDGEPSHKLPDDEVQDMLARQVENAAELVKTKTPRQWAKSRSNIEHFTKELIRAPMYAALKAARAAGAKCRELCELSAQFRGGKPLTADWMYKLIRKEFAYRRPPPTLPEDAPEPAPAAAPPAGGNCDLLCTPPRGPGPPEPAPAPEPEPEPVSELESEPEPAENEVAGRDFDAGNLADDWEPRRGWGAGYGDWGNSPADWVAGDMWPGAPPPDDADRPPLPAEMRPAIARPPPGAGRYGDFDPAACAALTDSSIRDARYGALILQCRAKPAAGNLLCAAHARRERPAIHPAARW